MPRWKIKFKDGMETTLVLEKGKGFSFVNSEVKGIESVTVVEDPPGPGLVEIIINKRYFLELHKCPKDQLSPDSCKICRDNFEGFKHKGMELPQLTPIYLWTKRNSKSIATHTFCNGVKP